MMVFFPEFYGGFSKICMTSSFNPKPTGVPVDFKLMIKSFAMVSILLNTRDIPHIALCLLQVNLTSG